MGLNLRLRKITSLVENTTCLADIGTDHAFLPIYLIENKMCDKVYATDIKKGPLSVARKNIKRKDLLDKIQLLEGPGLLVLEGKDCQAAVIAGMGGHLIRDILEEGFEIGKKLDYLILQANSEEGKLREYLYNSGFAVERETIVKDGKYFYLIVKTGYKGGKRQYNKIDLAFGRLLDEKMDEDMLSYFKSKKIKAQRQIKGLLKSKKESQEIRNKIEDNREIIRWLDKNVKGL